VDGGDIRDISAFCLDDVVRDECTKGVDVVVVLFGMNDLKKILSVNPLQHIFRGKQAGEVDEGETGSNYFRRGMDKLLADINSLAPNALVVFPALPFQPFHKNSIINIFPLGMLVDVVWSYWERQKKIAASCRSNAMYVELKAREIWSWYRTGGSGSPAASGVSDTNGIGGIPDFEDVNDILLSADGVHPNKIMYAKWGELVGDKLAAYVAPETEQDVLHADLPPAIAMDSSRLKQTMG